MNDDKKSTLDGVRYIEELAKEVKPIGQEGENVYCKVDYNYYTNTFRFWRSDVDDETVKSELFRLKVSTRKERLQAETPPIAIEFVNSINFVAAVVELRRQEKYMCLDVLNGPNTVVGTSAEEFDETV